MKHKEKAAKKESEMPASFNISLPTELKNLKYNIAEKTETKTKKKKRKTRTSHQDRPGGNRLCCHTGRLHKSPQAEHPSACYAAGTETPDHMTRCTDSTLSMQTSHSPLQDRTSFISVIFCSVQVELHNNSFTCNLIIHSHLFSFKPHTLRFNEQSRIFLL